MSATLQKAKTYEGENEHSDDLGFMLIELEAVETLLSFW